MPVYNHVHTKLRCGLNSRVYKLLKLILVSITALAVTALSCVHGKPHSINSPALKLRKGILIHILRKPSYAMRAHTLKLKYRTMFVCQCRSVDAQLTML